MPLAFVLDEHLRGPLWQAVLRHNLDRGDYLLDVVRVGDPPDLSLSADDPTILIWAERERRILITEDRHTMRPHLQDYLAAGRHSPGILIPRTGQPMRALIECLILIAYVGKATEFADRVTYIP
jgi:hypothetical protein